MEENEILDEQEEGFFEHHRIVSDKGQKLMRLDKFLVDRLERTSRNRIQNAAEDGYVKVNGVPVKSSYKVKPNDVITIEMPYPVRDMELIAEDIPIEIVYEDNDLVILMKPKNMVVHPGFGNFSGTLLNAMLFHFQNLPINSDARPGLVHRLDKNTTGLMVIAKTEEALTHLGKQFFDRTIDRRYVALVWGDVKEDGTVIGNTGRSLKDRKVFTVFPEGDHGKHAVTHYKVLKRYGYVTLVECKLETGRTHQIRVHMKHIGHTLFGDFEYGGDKVLKGTTFNKYKQFVHNCLDLLPRQALHARTLSFTHPTTGEWMSFESNLPDDMQAVLDKWENYSENSMKG
ncbi:MAG: RluA family pseudouridine synthase [Flavobacteriales bacterium]|jgi:23S rRNA pseudouridine1911/1915/1917 synthase|nr:RluA family pseudouridine synthase [Flavobacteriales bacterium]MDP4818875.1 RluA family pseudouridine synthase [Flavobacteriales bacterium]